MDTTVVLYAIGGSAVAVVALVVVWAAYELSKPPPKGGSRYKLPNGMEIQHWQASETDFLYTEIWGAESAYSRGGVAFRPGATIVDAGANIGMFTLLAAAQCKGSARILSFEPIPSTHAVLSANARAAAEGRYRALFGAGPDARLSIEALNVGLSDSPSDEVFEHHPHFSVWSTQNADFAEARIERIVADLPRTVDSAHSNPLVRALLRRLASLAANLIVRGKLAKTERVPVKLVTLASVLDERGITGDIDLLKVDVEGAEEAVLRGIREDQWARIQQVVLEVEDFATKDRICGALKARGFTCHWFPSERERNPGVQSEVCMVYCLRAAYVRALGKEPGENLPAGMAHEWTAPGEPAAAEAAPAAKAASASSVRRRA